MVEVVQLQLICEEVESDQFILSLEYAGEKPDRAVVARALERFLAEYVD